MALVAIDVGGTNVRFALAGPDGLSDMRSMRCEDFPSLAAALAAYKTETGVASIAASIAVAGPVQAPDVDVTNNHWHFSKAGLLAEAGLDKLLVVNDFTAQALAQADPTAHGNLPILGGASVEAAPLLVIGPGTGLGVSALVRAGDGFIPIEGEGGHVGMSPQSPDELALFAALRHEVGHVSAEHFVSGPGLETIYRLQNDNQKTAPEIGAKALAADGPERDAALAMLGILGSVIADAVLTVGCWRGVVIAGGIVAQLHPILEDSPFASRFRHDGVMGRLLADVPVWLCVDPQAGLRGAAAAFVNSSFQARMITAD